MKPSRDQWTALLLLVLAGLYLYGTFQYPADGGPGMPTARSFPLLLDGVLFILALALLLSASLRRPGRGAASGGTGLGAGEGQIPSGAPEAAVPSQPAWRRLGLAVALLFAYLAVLPRIGFVVSTVLLGVAVQVLLFSARWHWSLLWSVAMVAAAYWLFAIGLSVPLP